MKRCRLRILSLAAFCLLLSVLCFSVGRGEAADRGAGLAWLKEATGPRQAGMGGASVALTGDQVATGDNPGALAALRGRDFLLTHHELFAGIRQEYLGAAFGNGKRGVGFGVSVRTSGGIERRIGPTVEPLGTFSVYDTDFSLRYAQRVAGVYLGAGIRALHETVEADGASGVAFDIGGIAPMPVPHVTAGVALRHLGRVRGPGSSSIRLPTGLQAGIAYTTGLASGRDQAVIATEVWFPRSGEGAFRVGGEYAWRRLLVLRAGYEAGRDAQGGAFGFGVQRRGWRLDYALTPYRYGLGNAHRVSVGFR